MSFDINTDLVRIDGEIAKFALRRLAGQALVHSDTRTLAQQISCESFPSDDWDLLCTFSGMEVELDFYLEKNAPMERRAIVLITMQRGTLMGPVNID